MNQQGSGTGPLSKGSSSRGTGPLSVLRKTHVVTCFLMRTDERPARILLARRSQRVGSYNGAWAGISGFVEEGMTSLEQAYTEIQEETGLNRDQLRLLKTGAVVQHVDEALGRHFFIHPFLFEVVPPFTIQPDWEATEMRWIVPDELTRFETVPKLPEVYQSALHGEPA
uniref:Nudix hydrolase domain-containing protein n=1 Tax=Thermosporothrix sp. COM3 TaxID=2490863 RepID=A0A455SU35_9CHLR|nr:hypothetical protein KTC_43160 [Thermosporothrix sp. COM3]